VLLTDSNTGVPFKIYLRDVVPGETFTVVRVEQLPIPAPPVKQAVAPSTNAPAHENPALLAAVHKPAPPAHENPAPLAAVNKPAAPAKEARAPLAAVNKPPALKFIPPSLPATGDKPAARTEACVHGGDETDDVWDTPAPERDIQDMPLADVPSTGRGQAVMV
jgi:hypothetical protein